MTDIVLCMACKTETPLLEIDDIGQALVQAVKKHELECDYIYLPKFKGWARKETLRSAMQKVLERKNN